MKKPRLWVFAAVSAWAVFTALVRPGRGVEPKGQGSTSPTTGATWSGTIVEEEPRHIVFNSMETMSRTEYSIVFVEKVWPSGTVSLELRSLEWVSTKKTRDIIDRGYIHYHISEDGEWRCDGETGGCSFSGEIGYGEDESRPTGVEGHYGLSVKARGPFRRTGWETNARHVATGPMSHRLEPYKEPVDETYEGTVRVTIGGELENGLTTMHGQSGNVRWSISKAPSSVRVEIEPVDQAFYQGFVPEMRESVSFRVKIIEPAGMIGYPYFLLDGVSVMPGYCMNAEVGSEDLSFIRSLPGLASYDQKGPDLVLDAPEGRYSVNGQLQEVVGLEAGSEATMSVMALDAGALGRVLGGMIINGVKYPATSRSTGRGYFKLPHDANSNFIADAAPQDKAALPLDDLDAKPRGKGDAGDGLSAYEEYRGFLVAGGAHVRTDIDRKTIFVRNRYGHSWTAYRTLGLEAYDLEEDQLPPAGGRGKTALINFYHEKYGREDLHAQDQYAVVIVQSLSPLREDALAYVIGLHPPTAEHHQVFVLPEARLLYDASLFPEVSFEEYLKRLLDHELGHRVGIDHHGNIDEEKYRDLTGRKWWWVAVTGGEHSGSEDCAMRYHVADGFLADPVLKDVIEYDPPLRGPGFCQTLVSDPMCGLPTVTPACQSQFWVKSPAPATGSPAPKKGGRP